MATKWVYLFSEGNANMRNLLGGKGANLAEMTILVYRFLRDLQLQQKLVHSTMKMAERSMTRSWARSWNISERWKRSPARSLVIRKSTSGFRSFRC